MISIIDNSYFIANTKYHWSDFCKIYNRPRYRGNSQKLELTQDGPVNFSKVRSMIFGVCNKIWIINNRYHISFNTHNPTTMEFSKKKFKKISLKISWKVKKNTPKTFASTFRSLGEAEARLKPIPNLPFLPFSLWISLKIYQNYILLHQISWYKLCICTINFTP
jgi:hypothetical protein